MVLKNPIEFSKRWGDYITYGNLGASSYSLMFYLFYSFIYLIGTVNSTGIDVHYYRPIVIYFYF